MGRDLPARLSAPLIEIHFKDWRHYSPIDFPLAVKYAREHIDSVIGGILA
jgi:hypothetical protein